MIARIEQLEEDVRDMRKKQRDDIARLAKQALLVVQLGEFVRKAQGRIDVQAQRIDLLCKRVDAHVDCIRRLNDAAALAGHGRVIA